MLTATLVGICALLCLTHAQQPDVPLEQHLQRSLEAEQAVRGVLNTKLPPSAEAHVEGSEIFATLQRALRLCDEALTTTKNVNAFNVCVAEHKALALASIGELAGREWAKSGAARPGLFW